MLFTLLCALLVNSVDGAVLSRSGVDAALTGGEGGAFADAFAGLSLDVAALAAHDKQTQSTPGAPGDGDPRPPLPPHLTASERAEAMASLWSVVNFWEKEKEEQTKRGSHHVVLPRHRGASATGPEAVQRLTKELEDYAKTLALGGEEAAAAPGADLSPADLSPPPSPPLLQRQKTGIYPECDRWCAGYQRTKSLTPTDRHHPVADLGVEYCFRKGELWSTRFVACWNEDAGRKRVWSSASIGGEVREYDVAMDEHVVVDVPADGSIGFCELQMSRTRFGTEGALNHVVLLTEVESASCLGSAGGSSTRPGTSDHSGSLSDDDVDAKVLSPKSSEAGAEDLETKSASVSSSCTEQPRRAFVLFTHGSVKSVDDEILPKLASSDAWRKQKLFNNLPSIAQSADLLF